MTTQHPRGLSTTIGITIIAIAIVVVGVAVYFVYTSVQSDDTVAFAIQAEEKVVMQVGTETSTTIVVTSSDSGSISLSIDSPDGVIVEPNNTTIDPGASVKLSLSSSTAVDDNIQITATQGDASVSESIAIKSFSSSANVNTVTNTATGNTNIEPTNTNTNTTLPPGTDTYQLVSGDLNISMRYPVEWGESKVPELNKLRPVAGNLYYLYFENVTRRDRSGQIAFTATSANYLPTNAVGTPFWFAGSIDPQLPVDEIEKQILAAEFHPYEIEKVTIDGRPAVKVFHYRGYWNAYLDVSYLIPYEKSATYSTIMLNRSVALIDSSDEADDTELIERGKTVLEELKAGDLPDQEMRYYNEFVEAVGTIQIIQ